MSPKKIITPAERAKREEMRRARVVRLLGELKEILENSHLLQIPIHDAELERSHEIIADLVRLT